MNFSGMLWGAGEFESSLAQDYFASVAAKMPIYGMPHPRQLLFRGGLAFGAAEFSDQRDGAVMRHRKLAKNILAHRIVQRCES